MRFALLFLALCALAYGADTATGKVGNVGKNAKAKAKAKGKQGKNAAAPALAATASASEPVADRMLPVTTAAMSLGPAPKLEPYRPFCPHNNCQSCTSQPGCYWNGGVCTNVPCSIFAPCAITTAQCGGCQTDSQCGGAPRRCEKGQCVGVEGDKACDYYLDCAGCLTRPNCLWDPNTVTGSCKPKEQCDFTYQQRELVLGGPSLPPATACVRTVDRCGAQNLNGALLDLNTKRGIGCTNHGQCNPDQYCYSCSKCKSNCVGCQTTGVPVSGMCGPAWRCPIEGDSISQTCPIINNPAILPPVVIPPSPVVLPPVVSPVVVRPPANTCSSLLTCGPCTNTYGCVWSGRDCYYTTVPCTNAGCANTPQECPRTSAPVAIPSPATTNCAFNNCQNCAAAQGCAWSGQFCYYALQPCTNFGCANTPAQCGGCTRDDQCGVGRRCDKGACLASAGDRNCDYYTDCAGCLSNPNCLWDPNSFTHCKPKEQCDFTYRGLAIGAPAAAPPPATACVKTVDKCSVTDFSGAILTGNEDRGAGCTNHGQCLNGQYCFSCSKCRGDCSPCHQGGAPVSGACAPLSQCAIDLDSINDLCPIG